MIIQRGRIQAAEGADETAAHVFRGKLNRAIVVLRGCEQDLHDWVGDARRWRRRFALRHFKLCPHENVSLEQYAEAVAELGREMGFDPADTVQVLHRKSRLDPAATGDHVHLYVREVDPANGRVLSSQHDFARQEKVSRLLESRWGHTVIQGQHNYAVLATLRAEGRHEDADALVADGLDSDARPQAAYRTSDVQRVGRATGKSLPEVKQKVWDVRMLANNPQEFALLLNEQGLRLRRGDKDRRWIIEARGGDDGWEGIGSVNRLLGLGVAVVERWLEELEPGGGTHGQEAADEELVGERLRRPARGRARCGRAAGAGQPGHDAGAGGGPGHGVGLPQADEPAGRPVRRRRRERPVADRGTSGGAGGAGPRGGAVAAGRGSAPAAPAPGGGIGGGGGGGHVAHRSNGAWLREADEASRAAAARRLRRILEAAALEERLRASDRLDGWMEATRREPVRSLPCGTGNRTIACAEGERSQRERQLRFRALLLRRAYVLADHLPLVAVLNLRRIDTDPSGRFVLLTLHSGTQLLDTGDRVTVRGTADDIAIAELVACAERRGWEAVEVTGSKEFRIEASRALLVQGIEVVDCPLSEAEQAALRGEGPGVDWEAVEAGAYAEPGLVPRPPWVDG